MSGLPGSVQWIRYMLPRRYVTSLPVNYPLKNTSIMPALYTFGESASVMQFVYCMHFPASLHKTHKNEKYHKFPICIVYLPITL